MQVLNYLTLIKTPPQKSVFSGQILIGIEVMITSLTEVLDLPNSGHMTTSSV